MTRGPSAKRTTVGPAEIITPRHVTPWYQPARRWAVDEQNCRYLKQAVPWSRAQRPGGTDDKKRDRFEPYPQAWPSRTQEPENWCFQGGHSGEARRYSVRRRVQSPRTRQRRTVLGRIRSTHLKGRANGPGPLPTVQRRHVWSSEEAVSLLALRGWRWWIRPTECDSAIRIEESTTRSR